VRAEDEIELCDFRRTNLDAGVCLLQPVTGKSLVACGFLSTSSNFTCTVGIFNYVGTGLRPDACLEQIAKAASIGTRYTQRYAVCGAEDPEVWTNVGTKCARLLTFIVAKLRSNRSCSCSMY
jgi:hypothetical protein